MTAGNSPSIENPRKLPSRHWERVDLEKLQYRRGTVDEKVIFAIRDASIHATALTAAEQRDGVDLP